MRQKVFSSINIVGLAIGLTCGILLSLWIYDEISFDRFHKNGENIYRVLENQSYSSQNMQVAVTPAPLAESIKSDFPEIVSVTRYYSGFSQTLTVDEKKFKETSGAYADEDFFEMFSFPIIKGSSTPLSEINSIVLTEETAKKLFGDKEAVGKHVSIYGLDLQVTAIVENVPVNSHILVNRSA